MVNPAALDNHLNDLAVEIWKDIPGFDGWYSVSNFGNVRSNQRVIQRRHPGGNVHSKIVNERIMKRYSSKTQYGRMSVNLSVNGVAKTHLVHHLVMRSFFGEMPEGMEVAHNDGDPRNNRLDNLRYSTPMENTADKFSHGTVLVGEAVKTSKLTARQVSEIRSLRSKATVYQIADSFGISIAQVSRIHTGKRWGHLL